MGCGKWLLLETLLRYLYITLESLWWVFMMLEMYVVVTTVIFVS